MIQLHGSRFKLRVFIVVLSIPKAQLTISVRSFGAAVGTGASAIVVSVGSKICTSPAIVTTDTVVSCVLPAQIGSQTPSLKLVDRVRAQVSI